MTLTLLLDLDDTLLCNRMDDFIPAYFKSLSGYMKNVASSELLIQSLLKATHVMLENNQPDRTLKQTFDAIFYPELKLTEDSVRATIQQFYLDVFPGLQPLTHPMPGAKAVVEEAFRRGYQVVIATNPLFPKQAIIHRLAWAGLPPDQYPFNLVPSYETFHFAKPNPAYYAELLASIGWPDGAVIMVGDDLRNDIYGARKAGIKTYWVTDDPATMTENHTAWGSMQNFFKWLDHSSLDSYQPDLSTPSAIEGVLRSTPATIDNLCHQIPLDRWTIQYQEREWCQTEILCHLKDVEKEVHLRRIKKVLSEENPFLPGIDSDPWAQERNYKNFDGSQALADFVATRKESLQLLSSLTEKDWQRKARHAIFGPTSLMDLLGIMANHDRLHVHQIFQNLQLALTRPN